ncbi:right-handed parallel beta-helix repeat-containing protein [Cellulophaga lytica]|uniref:right-handed parallel beta-helix repeat-containing protein n=1 Tax=Cellulophaga lytica TaxID=979 RepID=UPI0026E248FE|nr:right-handed parallel beta-helix repeat-containing protein [Cellulophaga lytica]MDO6853308.1 right-handed parallel beta-helix repeat-containing protein [Cellulophaga lytica]
MHKQPLTLVKVLVFSLFIGTTLVSCSQEDLLANVIEENAAEEEPDTEPDVTPVDDLKINTTPCDYTLDGIAAGTTLAIECQLDLDGKTVSLPTGVTLEYKGGEIINGTLNFASQGKIDGNLLNSSIKIEGEAELLSSTLILHPSRWNLVQGKGTFESSLENRYVFENIMDLIKRLNGNTLKVGDFDAYFEVTTVTSSSNPNFYASVEAINVPADFNLEMSNNTHLRVFPNSKKTYALLAVRDVSNVTIKGGNLYGERDKHDYSNGESHEWGYVMYIHGATDTKVFDVVMKDGTGDGMKIQDLKFTFHPDYTPTHNLLVSGCTFDNNRRNNMSITGGNHIYIEDNVFLNASMDSETSEGVAPGFAIDIEATRKRDENGDLVYYERADDIFIRNNVEKNSRIGGFTVAIGYDVTIENNIIETGLSFSLANGVKIIGNTLTSKENGSGVAIKGGRTNADNETIYNNQISDNIIKGFGTGVYVTNRDVIVSGNNIENCKIGMNLLRLTNAEVSENFIYSDLEGSLGIAIGDTSMDNVFIKANDIKVQRNPIKLSGVNSEDDFNEYVFEVIGNKLNILSNSGSTIINGSNGAVFNENELNHGIEIFNSENISLSNNFINAVGSNDHGFDLRLINKSIGIQNNIIKTDVNKDCVNIDASTSVSEVKQSNNTCD